MEGNDAIGYRRVLFRGYSMYPAVRPGEMLILEEVGPPSVRRGDIVCLRRGRELVAHRVVDIHGGPLARILTTKGDNIPYPDPPLFFRSRPVLRVVAVIRATGGLVRPRFGKILAFLSRHNMTVGIVKGRIGRKIRALSGAFPPPGEKDTATDGPD